jgi:hypothetical protein
MAKAFGQEAVQVPHCMQGLIFSRIAIRAETADSLTGKAAAEASDGEDRDLIIRSFLRRTVGRSARRFAPPGAR